MLYIWSEDGSFGSLSEKNLKGRSGSVTKLLVGNRVQNILGLGSCTSLSAKTPQFVPSSIPLRIDSTGKNCMCLCGWLAPECSPELKNPKSSSPLSRYALRQSYAAARSSFSSKSVCCL